MLNVLALLAIAAGMFISAGSLVSLWIAARRQDSKEEDSTDVENSGRMTNLLARAMCAAAFLLGSTPMLMLVADVPVAQAKPNGHGDSGSPDGCVPMGVTKHSDSSVWAVERCHGQMYYERMTD